MPLLTTSQMNAIRAVAESGMTTRCSILTRAIVQTDDGQESVWATTYTDVPCWVYQSPGPGGDLGEIAGAVAISEPLIIRVSVTTNVNSGDMIAINSLIYNVQYTNADSTYSPWIACAVRVIE